MTAKGLQVEQQDVIALGWGRFALQVATVVLAFVAASVIPVLALGQESVGLALSALASMLGGLAVAWLWLRRDGAMAAGFNLSAPASWPRTLGWGVTGALVIVVMFQIGGRLTQALGLAPPAVDTVMQVATQSPLHLLLWIVAVAWLSAGLGEELLWRGFLMDRLSRLPGLVGRTAPVLVIHAVFFSLPHAYQGAGGMLITGVVGLFLGWLRLRMRGNLWACIIAHGLVDSSMLSLAYADKLGWLS